MGQAASRQVREEFEMSKAIAKLEDIYTEALTIRPPIAGA